MLCGSDQQIENPILDMRLCLCVRDRDRLRQEDGCAELLVPRSNSRYLCATNPRKREETYLKNAKSGATFGTSLKLIVSRLKSGLIPRAVLVCFL
jgi:hypothetical protein